MVWHLCSAPEEITTGLSTKSTCAISNDDLYNEILDRQKKIQGVGKCTTIILSTGKRI